MLPVAAPAQALCAPRDAAPRAMDSAPVPARWRAPNESARCSSPTREPCTALGLYSTMNRGALCGHIVGFPDRRARLPPVCPARRRPHRRGRQACQAGDQAHPGGEHREGDAARGPLGGALLRHVTAAAARRGRAAPSYAARKAAGHGAPRPAPPCHDDCTTGEWVWWVQGRFLGLLLIPGCAVGRSERADGRAVGTRAPRHAPAAPPRHPLVQRQAAAFFAARPCRGGDSITCARHPAAGWCAACQPHVPCRVRWLAATCAASKRCLRVALVGC